MNQNKKIALNSLILYCQLIISTFIGLFTTRIVLQQLGAGDFGLYAIVGGIVAMMGILSAAMFATSYRYIAIEIGKGENGNINKVFNTSLVIHLILAVLLLIIGETVGVWYINNYLNVLPNKIHDALFVLHFSLIASAFTVATVPFQGLITAKEKFIIRASLDIVKALLNLGFVLLLILYLGNKLRAYAVLMAVVLILPSVFLIIYCRIKDRNNIMWRLNNNIKDYKEMFGFTGWILIGTVAYMGVRQGAAVVINLFFGTIINAAFGIATQINNYIMIFVRNLNQAAVPQIMKSHSSGDSERSLNLVYSISKYAFFIMLLPAVPILLSINTILLLWLKTVPEYTMHFTIYLIINGLIGVTSSGFDAAIQATGKIRKTQIWYSIIMLTILPIAYIFYKLRYPPYTITLIMIGATIVNRLVQIKILAKITEFKSAEYWRKTVLPTILVSIVIIPQYLLRNLFGQDFMNTLVFSILSVVLTCATIYFIGLNNSERLAINRQLYKIRIFSKKH